jgi:hypothetical protein
MVAKIDFGLSLTKPMISSPKARLHSEFADIATVIFDEKLVHAATAATYRWSRDLSEAP